MIRAVIFDCFGVLYTDGKSRIIDACPPEKRQELADLFMQTDYGFISGKEFSQKAAALIGVDQPTLQRMVDGLYTRNEPLIHQLRNYKKQYKVGLLSNVSEQLFNDLFSPEDQAELFDEIVLSSRVGIVKPSEGIYALMASKLDVQPNESVMIDDMERNVRGAQDSGMYGIQFTSTAQVLEDIDTLLAEVGKDA